MKHLLILIFSVLLVQLAWTGLIEHSAVDREISCALNFSDEPDEAIFSMPMDQPQGKIASTELQSIARHMRTVSYRIQLLSENNLMFVKMLIQHLSQHTSSLTACATHNHTSFRLSSWKVPADCYVYSFRHIII